MQKRVNHFLFGPTPEEKVKKWQQQLKQEGRMLEREIRQLDQAANKVKAEVKKLALKGDTKNAKVLAREVVRSNKQKDRLHTSQARLNSINMQLAHQLATVKITGTLQKSTEIMKLSNSLIKLPELSQTMRAMSEEMMKAGIMSEMMDDTFESLDDNEEELEEEAQEEVDKVLWQITDGKLGQASGKVGALPANQEAAAEQAQRDEEMEKAIAGLLSS